jgi:hypothetical protein
MDSQEVIADIYTNVNEWIRFSDTKAAIILGIYGAVGAVALPGLIDNISLIQENDVLFVFLTIGMVLSILSVIFSILCLIPTLRIKGKIKTEEPSLIYFKNIAENYSNPIDYDNKINETIGNTVELQKQFTQQIWINSKIATKKYKSIILSVWFLIGSIIIGIVFVILSLLISAGN